MKRTSGVLLSVTSLPSKYGIGCFDQAAYDFVDWLADIVIDVEKHELFFVELSFDTVLAHCKHEAENKIPCSLLPSRLVFILNGT